MSLLQTQPWEVQLLLAAQEAFDSQRRAEMVLADQRVLDVAYRQCEDVTRQHSRTFFMASSLLPPQKRRAARALYAFCRVTDDLVDDPSQTVGDRETALTAWQSQVMAKCPPEGSPVCLAWADAQARFGIPHGYADQLIDGCGRDMTQTRYETFTDLAAYSYGVASTVGLMAMHVIGFRGEEAIPYAVRLGVALQLTNILRDVAEDWRNGRVYLPQEELRAYGLSEEDIERGVVTRQWRKFMAFQIERNRRLYDEALPGIAYLNWDGRFAIGAAAELYKAILNDIEVHDYDVFSRRAHVPTLGKLRRLPGIWMRSRFAKQK